ncbi:hypothetical protein [Enterovibrio nigricans]|uniref:DUF2570 domain-containing protein n=1 Tax=Enterovibrio nigricans DSM 22720 TaxID=1121868 RepID=A0A1T4UVE6_9GAMM|nr:hypothetical protein [Enterovibrio nigricans]PKF50911.1 hypothetical protein AT251_07780 [Enterovibrio nigricans]SKA56585.1 hypothetical protein SAMN02745132_02592 [Enterovibrio nigricans DSM 22720]
MNIIKGVGIGLLLLSIVTSWFLYQELEDAIQTNQSLTNNLHQAVDAQRSLNATIALLKESKKQAQIAADSLAQKLSSIDATKERVVIQVREKIKYENCYSVPIPATDGWLYQ